MSVRLGFPLLVAATILVAPAPAANPPAIPQAAQPPAAPQAAQAPAARQGVGADIAAATRGMERREGFVPVILDAEQGRIFLELPRDSLRALAVFTLATGLGSSSIGLDRGSGGASQVARFERSGSRVLVIFENWGYRSSGTPDNARTVAEAFPPSTVAALPLVAVEGGRLLVDATDFLLRDWNDVAGSLAQAQQGAYALARDRSGVYRPYTRAYPGNTEVDVSLTFATTGRPGRIVESIVPDAQAITLREHVSLVRLPDEGYRPREADPRVGFFGISFEDFAQPVQLPLERRWIARHRLERVDPGDPRSPIRSPIVYYIDRGIPEPIRTATFEGAQWWERAFAEAGLAGGFRVEYLPEGADPMDVRYNVVQWENRNERGWSVGGSVGDPRTGEIMKAMARMDSHRARTAYNLYAALMGADAAAADTAFVLARVRQVTAHEIGHTLGMGHNYIASSYERGSLMDYPAPRIRLDARGEIDLSAAYTTGPGPYDVWAIRWAYGIFPPGREADSLRAVVAEGLRRGFLLLSDADARPEYASDPRTSVWDDAATPGEFLRHQMAVRRAAISRFGERNIRPGEPLALLQERFAPLYFLHKFAVSALAKTIGGLEYSNALRGDGQQATRPVLPARQRAALSQLLGALEPEELAIPDTVLALIGPRLAGSPPSVELFGSRTQPAFDELGTARTLSQMVVDAVLQRERAARLVQFSARGADALSLGEAIDSLVARTWRIEAAAGEGRAPRPAGATATGSGAGSGGHAAALRRTAARAVADRLLVLAADRDAAPEVRALVDLRIAALRERARLLARTGSDAARAHWSAIAGDFTRWLERRELPQPSPALRAPPGEPFGIEP